MEITQTDRASRVETTMERLRASMEARGATRRIIFGAMTDRDHQLVVLQKRLRRALVKAEDAETGSFVTLPE